MDESDEDDHSQDFEKVAKKKASCVLTPKENGVPTQPPTKCSELSPCVEAEILTDSYSPAVLAEVVTSQDSATSPSTLAQVALPQAGPNEWVCTGCTFLNAKAKRKCVMCGEKKLVASRDLGRKKRPIDET